MPRRKPARRGQGPSQRQLRIGEELRHVLMEILARGELRDPVLAGAQITVTEVRISPDLKNATAFVVPFAGGDAAALAKALGHAAPFLRRQLADQMRLQFVPQLRFEPDRSFDQAERIDRLLRDPQVARDLAADGAADGEGENGA
ncbi:MAG: 30S ribosome-binding factor RbfA [Dongiaceae bacterium]